MEQTGPASGEAINRRKSVAWIGILFAFPILKAGFFLNKKKKAATGCAPPAGKTTMKLLSQDGQLYEADIAATRIVEQKVTDKELRDWIRKP